MMRPTGTTQAPLRVLVLTQYYRPEHAMIPTLLAEGLAARGHQVQVLTGFPNYPAGALYEGYRMGWSHKERVRGVTVHRVPLYIDHSHSAVKRVANYASFALSAATRSSLALGADVVYVYATQMTPALGPFAWRALAKLPFVLHVQDLWPDSITGSTMLPARSARAVESLLEPWLRATYRRAAATIGISRRMTSTLAERGVPDGRAHTVLNWADESARPAERDAARDAEEHRALSFVYAGNFGDLQDLETLIHAADRLRDEPRFHLDLFGSGIAEDRLRLLVAQLDLQNVAFHGRVAPADMPSVYATSDFQVLSLADLPAMRGTIPSKLPTSLLHGVPVVSAVSGAVAELVSEHRVGFTAAPSDPESLEAAFRAALRTSAAERAQLRARATATYENVMSLQSGIDSIERILMGAAAERRATT